MDYKTNREKWSNQSIFEQMGNIYSEVGRSINAKKRGNDTDSKQAIARALDLFDATSENLINIKSPKIKEVLRAKEVYLKIITKNVLVQKDVEDIDRYFMQFAIAARLNR